MDEKEIKRLYKKLSIAEDDVYQISETWGFDHVNVNGELSNVRRKFKTYRVILKDGTQYDLKMNALTKDLKEKSEAGYNLME